MAKAMKGFTVGLAAPAKKSNTKLDGSACSIFTETKLQKLEKRKLKLEKKIQKQMKKDNKKKCGTVTTVTIVPEVVPVPDGIIPTTTLQQAMAEAKARQEQTSA